MARKSSPRSPQIGFVKALAAAIIAATAAGCAGNVNAVPVGPQDLAVCVDQTTGLRVPDFQCGGESALGAAITTGFLWDYVNTSRYPNFIVPRVGVAMPRTVIVVHTVPRTVRVGRSLSTSGGKVSTLSKQVAQRPARTAAGAKPAGSAGTKPGTAKTAPKPGNGIQRGGFGVPSGRTSHSTPHVGRSSGS